MDFINILKKIFGRQRGYGLTGDPKVYDAYWKTIESMSKKELSELIRSNIEAFAPIQTIANDVLSAPQIVAKDKAQQDEISNKLVDSGFYKNVRSSFYDYLIYGDAYLEPVFDEYGKPVKIVWIPARTIEKNFDLKGNILGYTQKIGGKEVAKWKVDELIHISAFYYEAGGDSRSVSPAGVATFTPLSVAVEDLRLLDALKEYVRQYFESGGLPKAILKLDVQNMRPNSPEYDHFKTQLSEKLVEKRNGLVVTNIPVDVIQLQKSPEEMQYGDLYNLISKLLCVVWDVPLSRVYGSQQRSDEYTMIPYFSRIRAVQDEWARILSQKYIRYYGDGAHIKFTPAYARNQVRAVTWVVPLYKLGLISPSEARELMGLPADLPDDITTNPFYYHPASLKTPKQERSDEDERRARDNKLKTGVGLYIDEVGKDDR